MICPNCNFSDHEEDSFYCENCGTYLTNICENDECSLAQDPSHSLKPTAKFCNSCGCKSSFNYLGYFDN